MMYVILCITKNEMPTPKVGGTQHSAFPLNQKMGGHGPLSIPGSMPLVEMMMMMTIVISAECILNTHEFNSSECKQFDQ